MKRYCCLAVLVAIAVDCRGGEAGDAGSSGRAGETRAPAVAGSFYPASREALARQVGELLVKSQSNAVPDRLCAAVVPHAGYVFSGRCAASVFRLIVPGQYDRVIILGPSHHTAFPGVAVPPAGMEAWRTPLGDVPIDRAACDMLRRAAGFVTIPGVDDREHSIEVELPFLQTTAGAFRLVPLLCGSIREDEIGPLAKAIAPLLNEKTLLLASSDFTHYGPNYDFVPFDKDVRAQLYNWLEDAAGAVAALDFERFKNHCVEKRDTICGQLPIMVLMATLKAAGPPEPVGRVLDHYTSGDVVGDFGNSVSYAAIGFFVPSVVNKETSKVKEHRSGTWSPGLTDEEKSTLFAIARDTLNWCVKEERAEFSFDRYTITPLMRQDMATFVTLKIGDRLRGCIGSLAPVEPLFQSVHNNAINAALRDPRFSPVQALEVPRIEIDVSVLSPIRPIASLAEFKIGEHGIILQKGRYRAVYLPEVAPEQGWTVDETLASLSMKAGLPPDAWKKDARFEVFESVVLSQ